MTVQTRERLIYKGKLYEVTTLPLEQYLSALPVKPKFYPPSTACWRGYIGTWQIKPDGLYLVDLVYYNESGSIAGTDYFFPGEKEVIARWFSGEIRIPFEKSTFNPSHMVASNDEFVLEFKNGILVKDNSNTGR